MPTDKEKEILERIERKILNSSVLNGGFERLASNVEEIKEEQKASKEKLDNLFDLLHNPKEGVFSRLQTIEAKIDKKDAIETLRLKTEEKEIAELKDSIEETGKLAKQTKEKAVSADNFAIEIKKIAGKDLESLRTVVSATKHLTKIFWTFIGLIVVGAANLLFDLYKSRH